VKEKLKRDFQNWALAFESVPMLASSELVTNYRRLKTLGIEFPPKDPLATAAMVDSMSAPEWRDSTVCERCRTAFSFTNRKHHCRNCGGVFDGQCSGKKRALPHFGVTEAVRVCDGCERSLAAGVSAPIKSGLGSIRRNSFSGESSLPTPSRLSFGPNNHQRSATIHSGTTSARASHRYTSSSPAPQQFMNAALSREEADLERAIALSLQESAASQRPSFPQATSAPSLQSYHPTPSRTAASTHQDDSDEPELAAAIAASLRDAQLSSHPHPSAPMPPPAARSLETYTASLPPPHKGPDEDHLNTLLNFTADVDKATRLGQLVPSNVDLNNRHAQAQVARLDLIRGIENAERRTCTLKEMNEKLSQAVKLYDRLLSDQIMYRTRHVESTGTSAQTYQNYTNNTPSHTDHPYQTKPNQVFQTSHQASMYPSHNPAVPYPGQAVPISRNLTNSGPSDFKVQGEADLHPIQSHQVSSNYPSQQYSYPGPQQMPSHDRAVQSVGHDQISYSQERPAITSSHTPVAPTNSALPHFIHHSEAIPTDAWSPSNPLSDSRLSNDPSSATQPSNPSNNHSSYLGSQLPPMTQSPGIYSPSGAQLVGNTSQISPPNQFNPHDTAEVNQPQQYKQPTPGLSPVPHMISSVSQAHQNAHPPSPQGGPLESVQHDVQPSFTVSPKAPSPEAHHHQAPLGMHHQLSFPSAPQTSIESAAPLPTFPNVPNTQLSWSSSPTGPRHLSPLDVPTPRQEEVAPLIEF